MGGQCNGMVASVDFRFAGTHPTKEPPDVEFSGKSSPASTGVTVNYARIAFASLGAMVAYFVYGFAMFAAWPSMKTEFMKYPNVYRPKDEMMKVMPYGMVAVLIAIVVVAILYAKIYTVAGGMVLGIYLGSLIGLFSVCTFAHDANATAAGIASASFIVAARLLEVFIVVSQAGWSA